MQRDLVLSWLSSLSIQPQIIAEFDDSALMKQFAREGHGCFFSPSLIEASIKQQFDVEVLGHTTGVKGQFYAITPQRRSIHPVTSILLKHAKGLSQFLSGKN